MKLILFSFILNKNKVVLLQNKSEVVKKSLFVLISMYSLFATAQEKITGIVMDHELDQPLANVTVINLSNNEWIVTDEMGRFELNAIEKQSIRLQFNLLGKQKREITLQPTDDKQNLSIDLYDANLRLDEIVINVKKSEDFSEIQLGREQIDQVQAMSLNDVLEMLPGQSITNFTLNEFKPIVFRTAKPSSISNNSFGNKSFGTQVVLDGIPLSNNENMQSYTSNMGGTYSPNSIGFGDNASSYNGSFTNANYGVDLRGIATDNIENIEVVQGIPSAKYGDLTSGLIKIEQRAGRAPYRITSSLREGTMQHTFTKGFDLGNRAGSLNTTVDYLKSNADVRNSYSSYERIDAQLLWGWNNKKGNIRNAFTLDYGFNYDDANYEDQNTDLKVTSNKRNDFAISNRFKWNANKSWFDQLNINVNYRLTNQLSYDSKVVNVGGEVIATSLEEGVYLGSYTSPSYKYVKEVEGKPINFYTAFEFTKNIYGDKLTHRINYGLNYRLSDNKGRGRLGNPETQVNHYQLSNGEGGIGFRPYNYLDNVRAESILSLYIEDEMIRDYENSRLQINAGLRYDNFYGLHNVFQPRINAFYEIPKMKFRGAYGLAAKAPSLNQIYTGSRYYDVVLGDYRLPGVYNVAFVQTFIDDFNNPNLGPSKSHRFELGYDLMLPFGTINITGFYNKLFDGISDDKYVLKRELADIEVENNGTTKPDYEIVGYSDYYYLQNKIVNQLKSVDKGVEFFISVNKDIIPNFSFDFNGAYTKTTNLDKIDTYYKSTDIAKDEVYGLYEPYTIAYENFKIGGNISYHSSVLGLIISLRSEHFFIDAQKYAQPDHPYAFIDKDLNKHIIPIEDRNNEEKYGHIMRGKGTQRNDRFNDVYHNFHLRISKDFLSGFRFSFYVNNFLNLRPTQLYETNASSYYQVNPKVIKLSFGTKIEFKF